MVLPMYPYPPEYGVPPYPYHPSPWGYPPPEGTRPDPLYLGLPPPKINPPCSTLYVAGIDPMVPENEVSRLFSGIPGFRRMKLSPKEGALFAFVEYADIQSSTQALYTLNGFTLGNMAIRLEFAKNKMGEKGKTFTQTHTKGEGYGPTE
eukprot:TRINITY_DN8247_c0_g1_i4.p1 TRINITY_DN8247_c0_g1~~TRINITY_DN8247_c0_g1_i4.p1  ORF type:complete len:149 (-),score=28.90 TRINITY_DN8247_c0_g1_i4:112-558(-)